MVFLECIAAVGTVFGILVADDSDAWTVAFAYSTRKVSSDECLIVLEDSVPAAELALLKRLKLDSPASDAYTEALSKLKKVQETLK